MNTLKLSMEEAATIIRERYHLPETYRIEIEISAAPVGHQYDEWIDVPSDWEDDFPPPETEQYNKIEILMRCGYTEIGAPEDFDICWVQDNDFYDIIKWRPVK